MYVFLNCGDVSHTISLPLTTKIFISNSYSTTGGGDDSAWHASGRAARVRRRVDAGKHIIGCGGNLTQKPFNTFLLTPFIMTSKKKSVSEAKKRKYVDEHVNRSSEDLSEAIREKYNSDNVIEQIAFRKKKANKKAYKTRK